MAAGKWLFGASRGELKASQTWLGAVLAPFVPPVLPQLFPKLHSPFSRAVLRDDGVALCGGAACSRQGEAPVSRLTFLVQVGTSAKQAEPAPAPPPLARPGSHPCIF